MPVSRMGTAACYLPVQAWKESEPIVGGVLQGEAEMVDSEMRRGTQSAIPALDVLWITAGLGCDGDTIAMTAATQPSNVQAVRPGMPVLKLSAKTGEGMEEYL